MPRQPAPTSKPAAQPPTTSKEVGTISKTIQRKHRGQLLDETVDVQKVPVPFADVPHVASVTVKAEETINTGDFNSVKVGVMVSMPCIPTLEKVRETYEQVSETVDSLFGVERDRALGVTPSQPPKGGGGF